jgi:hypothetical protein
MISHSNKKLGYYTCGGVEFESKIQAFFHSKNTGEKVNWVFNDQDFKKYNWLEEPLLSLDQLYNDRARELREKYDYVVLSYSGGADSHNILMSFIRQGLHIDEILINTLEKGWKSFINIDMNDRRPENTGAEHYLQTIPRLKDLEYELRNTKVTICDLTDFVFDYFDNSKTENWVLSKKESLNPLGASRYNYLYLKEVRNRFDKSKSIGLIVGVDKPKCVLYNNYFYMRFLDRTANIVSIIDYFQDYDNTAVEFFYWSPDSVPLLIKQGHVIKKWVESNKNLHYFWESSNIDYRIIRTIHETYVRPVVYASTWNEEWFQVNKSVRDWHSEFDSWFINGAENTKANAGWKDSINFIRKELSDFVKVDTDIEFSDRLQPFAKYYNLGVFNRGNYD